MSSDSSDTSHSGHLSVTLKESRSFSPSREFSTKAKVKPEDYSSLLERSQTDPERYWEEAAEELHWSRKWNQVLEWNPPVAQWFVGGKLNASTNCLDRHLKSRSQQTALIWEGEPGEVTKWTYQELHAEVEKLTAALRRLGLQKGDRVALYMPMVPEAVVAMLACARGGFTHTVVFGGFSAEALKDRIQDAEAKLLITADGGYRKGGWIALDAQAQAALVHTSSVTSMIVLKRADAGNPCSQAGGPSPRSKPVLNGRVQEWDWRELLQSVGEKERSECGKAEELDSEHPLFILYTSGTTGKPKGIVHSTGGYMTGALRTTKTVFDLREGDIYWCTADIGWVTGHTYLVYGPLAAGTTILLYEGAPTYPGPDRFWSMIEKHQVSILYTAPTAIRAFMRLGAEHPKSKDLRSLRLLGTVGEPINPEAWMWYRENVGQNRCPIVDTFWQTETGSIVISALPGVHATKPGSATLALPGLDVEVVDKRGNPVPPGSGGYLVIRKPWPSMARTIHRDPERFKAQYWSEFPGVYFTGDGARKDEDGYIWCLGRVDDVLNVSGHRLGTMEIESALVSHPKVAEAAVVGRPDELKGQAIVAFVTLRADAAQALRDSEELTKKMKIELQAHVAREIGALARPDDIRLTESLPKTRSGKIMRRLLRELATSGEVKGDTTTLEDYSVIVALQGDEG